MFGALQIGGGGQHVTPEALFVLVGHAEVFAFKQLLVKKKQGRFEEGCTFELPRPPPRMTSRYSEFIQRVCSSIDLHELSTWEVAPPDLDRVDI